MSTAWQISSAAAGYWSRRRRASAQPRKCWNLSSRGNQRVLLTRFELALAYTELGHVSTDKDYPETALPLFERAFGLLDRVLKKNPRHTMALEVTHESHIGRALALTALGRYEQARLDWEAALTFRPDGRITRHHAVWQALNSAAQRKFAQALAELRALDNQAMAASDLLWLYRLAQAHALVAAGTESDSVPPSRALNTSGNDVPGRSRVA